MTIDENNGTDWVESCPPGEARTIRSGGLSLTVDKRTPVPGDLRGEIDGLIVQAVEDAAGNYQDLDWGPITVLLTKLKARMVVG